MRKHENTPFDNRQNKDKEFVLKFIRKQIEKGTGKTTKKLH